MGPLILVLMLCEGSFDLFPLLAGIELIHFALRMKRDRPNHILAGYYIPSLVLGMLGLGIFDPSYQLSPVSTIWTLFLATATQMTSLHLHRYKLSRKNTASLPIIIDVFLCITFALALRAH